MSDGLILLPSFMASAELLADDAQRWRFIKGLYDYRVNGIEFVPADPLEQMAWTNIQPSIDATAAKRKAQIENGKKGGNPNFKKGKPNPYFSAVKRDNITQDNPDNREEDIQIRISSSQKKKAAAPSASNASAPRSEYPEELNEYYKRSEDLEPEKTPEQLLAEQEARAERERAEKVREREKWETRYHVPAELKGKFEDAKAYFDYQKKQAIAALERRMSDNS